MLTGEERGVNSCPKGGGVRSCPRREAGLPIPSSPLGRELPSRASLAAILAPGGAGAFQLYSVVCIPSAAFLVPFPEPGSPLWRW